MKERNFPYGFCFNDTSRGSGTFSFWYSSYGVDPQCGPDGMSSNLATLLSGELAIVIANGQLK